MACKNQPADRRDKHAPRRPVAGITKTGVKTTKEKTKEILLKQMELLQEKSEQVEDLEDLCKLSDCIARIAQLAPCLV